MQPAITVKQPSTTKLAFMRRRPITPIRPQATPLTQETTPKRLERLIPRNTDRNRPARSVVASSAPVADEVLFPDHTIVSGMQGYGSHDARQAGVELKLGAKIGTVFDFAISTQSEPATREKALSRRVPNTEESTQSVMQTYKELKELAIMCAYNARTSTSTPVAVELWNMAEEYQRKAGQLGPLPDIGDAPPMVL